MTVKAIYEKGVFRPVTPVDLPELSEVDVTFPNNAGSGSEMPADRQAREEIMEILSHSYDTGQTDTAARHNEHQP